MKCAKRLDLVFCMVLLYITTAESFKCMECKTGDCKELKEVECVAAAPKPTTAAAPTAAPAGEVGGDTDKPPGDGGDPPAEGGKRLIQRQADAAKKEKWQCFTLVGKAKAGGKELTIKGCTSDGKCISDLVEADGQKCTPCDKEKCNSGEHLKPTTLSFILFTVMTCLVISHH